MRDQSHWEGLPKQITALVVNESDRGAILILGAYLEELLGEVIAARCLTEELAEQILDFRRPAGDFDSRIRVAHAFGLIHPLEAEALQCVRKIRNRAAHFDRKGSGFNVLFDSDATIDQVANLARKVNLTLSARTTEVVRDLFVISCRLVAIRLMGRALESSRPESLKTMNEIAAEWRERMKGSPIATAIAEATQAMQDGDPEKMKAFTEAMKQAIEGRFKGRV